MDRPGYKFLARAAFAANMHAGVGRGDQGDAFEYLLDGRGSAHDRFVAIIKRRRLGAGGWVALCNARLMVRSATFRSKGFSR